MKLDEKALEAAARALFPLMAEEVTGRAPIGGYDQALGVDQKWMREASEAAITAYLSAMAEKGFRMMPRKATEEMLEAAMPHFEEVNGIISLHSARYSSAGLSKDPLAPAYTAMFDAASKEPQ